MFRNEKYSLEISPRGRGMLFNKQSGEILTLNVTGAFIATMLQKPADIQVIIRQFAQHFELTEEAAGEDVLEFLEELRKLDLLDEGVSI